MFDGSHWDGNSFTSNLAFRIDDPCQGPVDADDREEKKRGHTAADL